MCPPATPIWEPGGDIGNVGGVELGSGSLAVPVLGPVYIGLKLTAVGWELEGLNEAILGA